MPIEPERHESELERLSARNILRHSIEPDADADAEQREEERHRHARPQHRGCRSAQHGEG